MKTLKLSLVATALVLSSNSFAFDVMQDVFGATASGFGAQVLETTGLMSSGDAQTLDRIHGALGSPAERGLEAVATYYYPGSVQAYRQVQQFGQQFPQAPVYQPSYPGPGAYPYPQPVYGPNAPRWGR